MTFPTSSGLRPRRLAAAVLALGTLLAGCEGNNAWTGLPTTPGGQQDKTAPEVRFVAPDSTFRAAVGDSLRIEVRVQDNAALDSLTLTGYSVRGNPELTKPDTIARFQTRRISLRNGTAVVRDTALQRFLLATNDSVAGERVFLIATARDTAGNVGRTTMQIRVGGPRISILAPTAGQLVRAGTELRVALSAMDTANRIRELIVRTEGVVQRSITVAIEPPVGRKDTTVSVQLPSGQTGELRITAVLRSLNNDSAKTTALPVTVVPAVQDVQPPSVRFTVDAPDRVEWDDTVSISVSATDSTRVDRVGVSVVPIRRLASGAQTLPVWRGRAGGPEGTFRFAISDLGVPRPDSAYIVSLEVTALAWDAAGNCAASTRAGSPQTETCVARAGSSGMDTLAATAGARSDVFLVRGATVAPRSAGSLLVDLAAAGGYVYASNITGGTVDIVPVGGTRFTRSVEVGSEPWGITVGRTGDSLYVANSGGTNISVLSLSSQTLHRRITTPDIRLYSFDFDIKSDSVNSVSYRNYSDRPQYIGQLRTGQLIYSTKPTAVEGDGTIRIIDPTKDTTQAFNRATEIFAGYAVPAAGKGIVVNALSASFVIGKLMQVCPRRRLSSQTDPDCVIGSASAVARMVADLERQGRTDTRVVLAADIASIGLTDTTFVAVSRDHSTLVFGEGGTDPGRIFLFRNTGSGLNVSTTQTEDLVGNAAERVISLSLNGDGTLGAARGRQVYFFDPNLRLQGVVPVGTPSGGSALDPLNVGYPTNTTRQRGFVSGVDALGRPYIETVDSYTFRALRRIYTRDLVVGSLIAVPVTSGDPQAGTIALRVFAITRQGLLQLGISAEDLR